MQNFIAEQVTLDKLNSDPTCGACGGEGGGYDDWGHPHVCGCCGGSGDVPVWMLPPRLTTDNWVAVVEAEMKEVDAHVAQ